MSSSAMPDGAGSATKLVVLQCNMATEIMLESEVVGPVQARTAVVVTGELAIAPDTSQVMVSWPWIGDAGKPICFNVTS